MCPVLLTRDGEEMTKRSGNIRSYVISMFRLSGLRVLVKCTHGETP